VAVVIITFGGWRVATGRMDVSDLIGFLLCTGGFFLSIVILAELYNTTLQAMAGGERIFALLDTKPNITDPPNGVALAERDERTVRTGARVEFDHVTFGYSPERPVLHDVSFAAEPGSVLALVGHTGSGKTSIVNLIARLYEHQGGRILIDGTPIEHVKLGSLHRQIALVLQDNFLFDGTVAENIRFARPEATDEEVREACAELDCLDVLERLPQGLSSDVGERGGSLSLGQRQLVCFARAMIADPRLLMLDEATSAVDTFTEYRIQRALERLMEGRTCVIVAHRLSTIRRADQILVLEHGHIVERGTHRQLMQGGGRYEALYREFVRLATEAG
jgi:ATP-binding cassette subfamily B protein